MIPKALTQKDYKKIALELLKSDTDPLALLKQWEIQFLEINEKFHIYLAKEIESFIREEMRTVNEILKVNPKMKSEEAIGMLPIDTYSNYKAFVCQRGLTLAYEKELGFDLVEIVRPIVQKHIEYYQDNGSVFNWTSDFKKFTEKCKLQFQRLTKLKNNISIAKFKREVQLEVIRLEIGIDDEEKSYTKAMTPKNNSNIELNRVKNNEPSEKTLMLWTKFINSILIDFTKQMFPEITEPSAVTVIKSEPKEKKITLIQADKMNTILKQKEITLFYAYLFESNEIEKPSNIKKFFKNVANEWKREGKAISGNTLYNKYIKLKDLDRNGETFIQFANNIQPYLKEYPKALKLLKKDIDSV